MTAPVVADDPPPETSQISLARFSTVGFFSLPLIAGEIFSNTYWAVSSSILSREFGTTKEFLLSPFFQTGAISGLLTIVAGHLFDLTRFFRRRFAIVVALILQIAGFSLLSYLDGKFANGGISDFSQDSRIPFLCSGPGCFCSQFSISLLHLCGRSFIFENFAPLEQVRAHSWIATFSLGVTFAFRVTFGIVVRSTDPASEINLTRERVVGFAFGVIGLIIGFLAVFLIREDPAPAWGGPRDWDAIRRFDSFPEFLQIAVPLIVGIAPYAQLGLMIPLHCAVLATDSGEFTFSEGFGYGSIAIGCAAVLGIATAWVPHPRGALVWSMFVSAVVVSAYDYQRSPPSVVVCLTVTVLSGGGFGALFASPWSAFGQKVPSVGTNGFIGLQIGLATMFQGIIVPSANVDRNFFLLFSKPRVAVLCLVFAGVAALLIPDPPAVPDPGYASINAP
jgi:hypothetical protein